MDGTDGSTTFTDAIGTHTVTAVGNAQIDTAQYKFGGASGLFDGTGDYLTIPDHADFNFGAGDFTIDFWVRFNAINTAQAFISQTEDANNQWVFRIDATNTVEIYFADNGVVKYISTVFEASILKTH